MSLAVRGLSEGSYRVRHRRLDERHSNLRLSWERLGSGHPWPGETTWSALRAADRLEELEPERVEPAAGGAVRLEFDLPMPALSLVELEPLSRSPSRARPLEGHAQQEQVVRVGRVAPGELPDPPCVADVVFRYYRSLPGRGEP
ncbi:MAG TPA: hypothetical protein VNO34_06165 [Actinomycetota bacterium]|nr:hypothetical protein [Actinomycetota bacterium]